MKPEELDARVLGVRQAMAAHFGDCDIEIIEPIVLPLEVLPLDVLPLDPEAYTDTADGLDLELAPEPANGLAQIRADLGDCQRCDLCATRKNIVFGVGNPDAELVVVGEAPGANEDATSEPFVGRAGKMLDRMMQNVLSYERGDIYIMNVIKCRPNAANGNPTPEQLERCRPFFVQQLRAIRPKAILLLGSVALRAMFDTKHGILKNRGQWREFEDIPVMPTFHPSFLLRPKGREHKQYAFADLKALRDRLSPPAQEEELAG